MEQKLETAILVVGASDLGHSIGDGIIVASLAALCFGYLYFKYQTRIKRLELIHQERLVAMDKDFPLPELPIDPPREVKLPDPHVPLMIGIVLAAFGGGCMIVMACLPQFASFWITPLPVVLIGIGLIIAYRLTPQLEA